MKKHLFIFLMIMAFTLVFANPYAESQEPPKPPIVIAVDGLYFGEIGPKPVEVIMKKIFPDKTPDGYIGKSFKEDIPASIKNLNPEIKTYTWSRDTVDTRKVVDDLKTNIKQAYEVAKNDNRALIIVGHSWGSAMSYKALEELGSEVKVDSFITMGSPLNADNVAVKKFTDSKFKEVEVIPSTTTLSTQAAIIEKPLKIEKPKGVDKWINYWANGDIISGSIPSADRNIQIDKGKETLSSSQRYTLPTSGLDLAVVKTATEKWHSAYYDNNEWKEDIAVNMTSAMIRHEVKTAASSETSQKPATQPASSSKKSDKPKTEESKSVATKQGTTTTTIKSVAKKETTPSASSSEKPKQVTVIPKPAPPSTAKPDAPKISDLKGEIKTQQTLSELKQKLIQLQEALKQLQNESIKKQAATTLPTAKIDAVKMIDLPKNLPMNLPLGKVSDSSKLRETTGQEKLTPVDVRFTQTFDGLFTQSADFLGSQTGTHSGTLTDGTRVNVKGDSVAGDFTGSFSGQSVGEPGYTPATHNNSAFSGSSVGTASAKGFKEGDLKGTMTVTIPAGTQTTTVTGNITIKTDGSLSMPSYSGPTTVNATGVKVGTMSGSWSQGSTR